MKTKWPILLAVALMLGAGLSIAAGAPVTTGPSADALAAMTAQEVTAEYYAWYLDLLDAEVLCNPLYDGTYRASPLLSRALVAAIDRDVAEACGFGLQVDPFLCTATAPQYVTTRLFQVTDTTARVLVSGNFLTGSSVSETRALSVAGLVREDGLWVLDAVTCR